jgi:type IV pilus assembly protein PilM
MTSWNAITPFSSAVGPGDGAPAPDRVGYPLGFVDVRADASDARELSGTEQTELEAGTVVPARAVDADEQDPPQDSALDAETVEADADESPAEIQEEDEVEPVAVETAPAKKRGRRSRPKPERRRGGGRSKVVGLKIGASQLAAAVVSQNGSTELLQLVRSPLEPGIVVDGEVRDGDALANALRTFFSEHQLPTRDVRIGLSSNRIGVRTFDIVGVDDEARFDNAVRFKAHEVLPVAVHESVLDYRILGERFSESGESMRHIFLVVAPKDQVEPYLAVAQQAGLRLRGIDLEALALLRTFVEPRAAGVPVSDDRATVVAAIGHEASTLLVSGGGICEFTRVFDWGGSTLQEAIAQELDLPAAEAATILHHLSLTGPGRELPSLDAESRTRALEAVRLRLTPFARELVASLQFYQTQPDSLGIGEIVVTGGASHLEGLSDALNQMIGVSVRVGDPLSRVDVRGTFDADVEAAIGSLSVPIGLAIEDFATRSVDLIPREARGQRRRPSLARVLVPAAVAVPVAAMAFLFVQASSDVDRREERLAAAEQELAALPRQTAPVIDPQLQGDGALRATAVSEVLGSRLAWDGVLRDLSRVLPSDISLTQLNARVPRPLGSPEALASAQASTATPATPGTAVPTGVTLAGYTFSHTNVARLIARLATVPSLTNVQLQSSAKAKLGRSTVVNFTILADLREAGGAK